MKDCNQCGKCCTQYSDGGLSATDKEIAYWKAAKPDIYAYVNNGNIWIDPVNKKQLTLCPWLKKLPNQQKYICEIYDDRPDDCRHYPVTISEMIRDGCEMIEAVDLTNSKRAQHRLDRLMAASRPSVR